MWKEGTRDIQMERHCALGCAEKQSLSKWRESRKGYIVDMLYYSFEKLLYTADTGQYTGYGIRALRQDKGKWECVDEVGDISCEEKQVKKLAELCTELALEPVHLRDVVEDMLGAV